MAAAAADYQLRLVGSAHLIRYRGIPGVPLYHERIVSGCGGVAGCVLTPDGDNYVEDIAIGDEAMCIRYPPHVLIPPGPDIPPHRIHRFRNPLPSEAEFQDALADGANQLGIAAPATVIRIQLPGGLFQDVPRPLGAAGVGVVVLCACACCTVLWMRNRSVVVS